MPRSPAPPAPLDAGLAPAPRRRPRKSKAAVNREHLVVALGELHQASTDITRMLDRFKSCGPDEGAKEGERKCQADGIRNNVSEGWEAARHA